MMLFAEPVSCPPTWARVPGASSGTGRGKGPYQVPGTLCKFNEAARRWMQLSSAQSLLLSSSP